MLKPTIMDSLPPPTPPLQSSDASVGLDREFELFDEMAHTILEAAEALVSGLEGGASFDRVWQTIRDLEHKGDAIARDLLEVLIPAHGSAPDRDGPRSLTGYLDDVLDAIEAAAARLAIHRVRRALPAAREMGQIILQCAREIKQAVDQARRGRHVFPHTRMLHRLENRGDEVLRDVLEVLFTGRHSAKDIIKWKDICEMLEGGTDRCEDIANVLEALVVRRGAEHRLAAGRLIVDTDRHEAAVSGEPISLTAKEFGLLQLLLRHQSKVVRRERLLREVWGEDYFGDSRTLDTHVGWLRKKVEARGGIRILAVRGIGYRLDLI